MIKGKSFTLVEVLTIVGILIVLTAISIPAFRFFQRESDLNNSVEETLNILRLAQNKTIASEGASQYGVHFETEKFVLFKGVNYDPSATDNEIHNLPKSVEIYKVELVGGGSEVVFDRVTGTTNQFGKVYFQLKTDISKNKTIYIENSGQVGLTSPTVPSETGRIKDWRHTHFDYGRPISTPSESLTLNFEGGVTKTIIISENFRDGQIYWDGQVDVGGQIQKLKIHTHRLNNPDTQFSIHRDRRYNNKSLDITLSGDSTGSLINYSTDGLTVTKTSIYAADPQRQ